MWRLKKGLAHSAGPERLEKIEKEEKRGKRCKRPFCPALPVRSLAWRRGNSAGIRRTPRELRLAGRIVCGLGLTFVIVGEDGA